MEDGRAEPIRVHGRNLDIDSRIREYASRKAGRGLKYFGGLRGADVELAEEANPRRSLERFRVEITARSSGQTVRAEGAGASWEQAIDAAADRFEKQARRLGDRMTDRRRRSPGPGAGSGTAEAPAPAGDEMTEIVRRKQFVMKPMTPEDAALAMAELGHSFFFFLNFDTGLQSVLYRRRDGRLGLIEPR